MSAVPVAGIQDLSLWADEQAALLLEEGLPPETLVATAPIVQSLTPRDSGLPAVETIQGLRTLGQLRREFEDVSEVMIVDVADLFHLRFRDKVVSVLPNVIACEVRSPAFEFFRGERGRHRRTDSGDWPWDFRDPWYEDLRSDASTIVGAIARTLADTWGTTLKVVWRHAYGQGFIDDEELVRPVGVENGITRNAAVPYVFHRPPQQSLKN
jgi:hypothetical protein